MVLVSAQTLAPQQSDALPPVPYVRGYPLHLGLDSEEDATQPEQQEPKPEQQEPEPEQQEQKSKLEAQKVKTLQFLPENQLNLRNFYEKWDKIFLWVTHTNTTYNKPIDH